MESISNNLVAVVLRYYLTLISEWLGHKNFETTLIYAHADTEIKRKAIEKAIPKDTALHEHTDAKRYKISDEDVLKQTQRFTIYGMGSPNYLLMFYLRQVAPCDSQAAMSSPIIVFVCNGCNLFYAHDFL